MNWNNTNSFWHDSHRILFNKDCRSMEDLPDESIQMVVTSPPYWGLRKYAGLPDLIWGGNGTCEHKWGDTILNNLGQGGKSDKQDSNLGSRFKTTSGQFCSLCGAWKGQLGLEPTLEMYIDHLVQVFREVKRVLRSDGVVFLNIGDSYAGSNSGKGDYREKKGLQKDIYDYEHPQAQAGKWDKWRRGVGGEENGVSLSGIPRPLNLKPKDLCLIPFRLAIALQEDKWWVRSVIIWNKPNPMPESVTDRPTESHEYILMLTKSARYYYDQEAVRSPYSEATLPRMMRGVGNHKYVGVPEAAGGGAGNQPRDNIRKDFEAWQYEGQDTKDYGEAGAQSPSDTKRRIIESIKKQESGANLKSVWTFPTQPYPEAHFATYPEELVRRCVKAATPEVGCCSKCGRPWVRIIDKSYNVRAIRAVTEKQYETNGGSRANMPFMGDKIVETLGWKPQCKCNTEKVPSIVLDPFAGSGTTLKVSAELNRRAIGYELSEEYCRLAVERNKQGVMG